jgi:DNA-binding NarL/FixJ family response regulator
MINILIVDDHQIVRDAVRFYFKDDSEFTVAGEAENGVSALELLKKNKYDIVLTDIQMPEMDGMEFMRTVNEKYPEQKVLVLSMYNEAGYITKMISHGAHGYLLKRSSKAQMVDAIRKILADENYYQEEVSKTLIDSIAKRPSIKQRLTVEKPLTQREKEVLILIANDHSNAEIAEKLNIGVRTVETHKRNLLERTGCKNIAGLVMYAVERNLV